MSIFDGLLGSLRGNARRKEAAGLLPELGALSHVERTQRMVALGQAARDDGATRELLGELWRTEGDAGPYARRLVLKSCYGSRDGARVLQALSDPSRLLRAGARKLVALCCDDTQATGALQTTWYVRQHLPLLSRLWAAGRLAPIDAFLDWLALQPGDTRLADCVPYGSPPAIERHLAAALRRPSVVFWEGLLCRAPQILVQHLLAALSTGQGKPEAPLCWVVERSLPRLCVREPLAALSVIDAYLARGQAVPGSVWGPLSRRQPAQAIAVAARHRVPLPRGLFERAARKLTGESIAALLRHDCFALGDPQTWFRFLSAESKAAVLLAWRENVKQQPSWGAALLRQLALDPALGTPEIIDDAYARWSPAAQDADGVIALATVVQLPASLAEREGRRHLTQVTALQTRPQQRLPYARFLPWDEALASLKPYIGHPEGDVRGRAVAVLIALAGHTPDAERRTALVIEALRLVKARKNEQDPVRLALLQALVAWPRWAWSASNLGDVGQILRDALDAADLSHATAQMAEQLVVRLFRLDGEWGGKWLATLIKERGTIYAPRLGDQLTADDVRAVAPHLLEVAKAWALREREGHLVNLAASLAERLDLVPGLVGVLERVLRSTASAGHALSLATLLAKHQRPRFLAIVDDLATRWLSQKWDSALASLTQSLKRGEVPASLVSALELALERCIHTHQASNLLSALALRAPSDFARIVPACLARDRSFVCVPTVYDYLHVRRTDLLTPYLGGQVVTGRFATGNTRWLLPFEAGFFRWTPQQQELFGAQIGSVCGDQDRDTPSIFWALCRLPNLGYVPPTTLVQLADDRRPAVMEKAVRVLGRCDAGQGVPKLMSCLDDARARYAIYGLRRAVLEMPPDAALPLLRKVPLTKVTVAKEVVRLLGELRSDAAYAALLALDAPTLHRDIRIALLRALWDHLEREETWGRYRTAATGPDWVLASRVGDIPADRLTVEVDRKLSQVLALVVGRPEPEARLDLLRRAPGLPIKDAERAFLTACLARLDSRFADETLAAWQACAARAAESDASTLRPAFVALRSNRRALSLIISQLLPQLPTQQPVVAELAEALLAALATDDLAAPMFVRLGLVHYSLPSSAARWLDLLHSAAQRGLLHSVTLEAAGQALRGLPITRLPIAALDALVAQLGASSEPALRYLGLVLLTTLAAPEHGQGYTPARRAVLQAASRDPAPIVASFAQFCFPPAEEAEASASAKN